MVRRSTLRTWTGGLHSFEPRVESGDTARGKAKAKAKDKAGWGR